MRLSRATKAIRKLGLRPHIYVVLTTHAHTPDVSSHMRHQSLDPFDGPVCCSAIQSADPQLLETYDLVEKR